MGTLSSAVLADEQNAAARASSARRSARTINGRHPRALCQTMSVLLAGQVLGEHESLNEATLQVLAGRLLPRAGDDFWDAATGDYLVIPPARHAPVDIDDCTVLLSVVIDAR